MPEIKHDFSGGKMNKDLDERIVPNGSYRDAMNIQVRTTNAGEGGIGDSGTVQSIQGNKRIQETINYEVSYNLNSNNESNFIGSVANEQNNKMYYFIASPSFVEEKSFAINNAQAIYDKAMGKIFIDYIVEVDTKDSDAFPTCDPVFNDRYAIIDSITNFIDVNDDNLTEDQNNWITLKVKNAQEYRVGMCLWVYGTDPANPLISNAEIVKVDTIENKLVFNTEQNPSCDSCITFSDVLNDGRIIILKHPSRVLNFEKDSIITGINIVDDLLLWSDNRKDSANTQEQHYGEPKKINITRCKAGTSNFLHHTQLKLASPTDSDVLWDFVRDPHAAYADVQGPLFHEHPLDSNITNDYKEDHVTVIRKAPLTAPTVHMSRSGREGLSEVVGWDINFESWDGDGDGEFAEIQVGEQFSIPNTDDLGGTTDNSADEFNNVNWINDDIVRFVEQTGIKESFITCKVISVGWSDDDATTEEVEQDGNKIYTLEVMSIGDLQPVFDSIEGSGTWAITLEDDEPLFELKFGRFSTRYKYEDGEYSNFGPWSELAFLPGRFDFDHKKGYNLGMANQMRELYIRDFIPHQRVRPHDVVCVDVLYKTTESPNVYIVKSIHRGRNPEWDLFQQKPEDEMLDVPKSWFGEIHITSEMIYKTVPGNQLLRAWDNVPLRALGQEVAANRIVYANYEQGYEISNQAGLETSVKRYSPYAGEDAAIIPEINYDVDKQPHKHRPAKSLKSIRDYKVGVVYGDKYGRETPVVSVPYAVEKGLDRYAIIDGNINVQKIHAGYASVLQVKQLWGETGTYDGIPDDWISYVKYYVKETTNEYYNIVMDRWYYAEDGNIWLAFASSDRNKVDEETYLILKNEHGYDNPVFERARYKIIAIKGEAPEFIKRSDRNMGQVTLGVESYDYMFDTADPDQSTAESTSPTKLENATEIVIAAGDWNNFLGGYENPQGDLEIRIKARADGITAVTKQWKLVTYHHTVDEDADEDAGAGGIRWDEPFGQDADMLDRLAALGVTDYSGIEYFMEFREMVVQNKPEFDGKFFCKIEKDVLLESKVLQMSDTMIDYDTTAIVPLSYIENKEFNPSVLNATWDDQMPRRAYRWLNGNATTQTYDGQTIATGVAPVTGGAPEDTIGNIPAEWVGASGTQWNNNCSGTGGDYLGEVPGYECQPRDAELLGIGCCHTVVGGNSDWPADAATNQSTTNFARGRMSFNYWSHVRNNYMSGGAENTGARLFIDGARSFETRLSSGGASWNSGEATIPADPGAPVTEWPGLYYKQTGMDAGVQSSTTFGTEFGITPPGHLGRMVISKLGTSWSSSESSIDYKVRDMINQNGLFQFENDPQEGIYYKVVGSPVEFESRNYATVWDENTPNQQYNSSNFGGTGGGGVITFTTDNLVDFTNSDPLFQTLGWSTEEGPTNPGFEFTPRAMGLNQLTINSDCPECGHSGNSDWLQYGCARKSIRFEFRRYIGGALDPADEVDPDTGAVMHNGLDPFEWDPRGTITHDGREALKISLITKTQMGGEIVIPVANAAIWETEPKEDVGLDIYYEASNALPKTLTSENTTNFIPYNAPVRFKRFVGGGYTSWAPSYGGNQEGNTAQEYVAQTDFDVSYIGYTKTHSIVGIKVTKALIADFSVSRRYLSYDSTTDQGDPVPLDRFITFRHKDGTITMSQVIGHMKPVDDDGNDYVLNDEGEYETVNGGLLSYVEPARFKESEEQTGFFKLDSDVWKFPVELAWHNCWSYANGVESDRIRDDFNANQIDNGVKASANLLDYGREKRGSSMIYSGIYNNTSSTNKLNEFNMAEKITKDINPSYGSIQRLKTRDTDMVVLTEDKVLKVTTNKDALYNADGNPQLLASNRVLGTAVPYAGDYGISKNPESLAWDQFRLYFTDKQRGAVLRLSRDGITPISNVGMRSWFREHLRTTTRNIGTFDSVNGEYNLTMRSNSFAPKTLSFNEEAKGWVSFKSFIPEVGGSVGGKYLTAVSSDLGDINAEQLGIWLHYQDISSGDKILNRNVFYADEQTIVDSGGNSSGVSNYHEDSSVTVVFNDAPEQIKTFRAASYDGSQARINQFTTSSNATQPDGTSFNGVSDNEYYNLNNVNGWWIDKIRTNQSYAGWVNDFKEREGKWYQNINGERRDNGLQESDLTEFSVQGLGQSVVNPNAPVDTTVTEDNNGDNGENTDPILGCTNPIATNYNPNATMDDGSCVLPDPIVYGCTNPLASNYNPNANVDDGSCIIPEPESDSTAQVYVQIPDDD